MQTRNDKEYLKMLPIRAAEPKKEIKINQQRGKKILIKNVCIHCALRKIFYNFPFSTNPESFQSGVTETLGSKICVGFFLKQLYLLLKKNPLICLICGKLNNLLQSIPSNNLKDFIRFLEKLRQQSFLTGSCVIQIPSQLSRWSTCSLSFECWLMDHVI